MSSKTKESLTERLRMDHLETSAEALKEEIDQASAESPDGPPDEEIWSFPFTYKDARGKLWTGNFVNEILDVGTQAKVAVMRSRLQGGQPEASIDSSIVSLNFMVAWLSFSLRSEGRPEWAKDLSRIKDVDLIGALYEKARAHEDRYFRRSEGAGA